MIVLRHVDGSRWCVVQHEWNDGKRSFVARIATAREYDPAARIAIAAAAKMRLHLGIEGNGHPLRPFDHKRHAPLSAARNRSDFCEPYGREDF